MRADDLRHEELLSMDHKRGFPLFGSLRIMLMGGEPLCRFIDDLGASVGHEKMQVLLNRFGYEIGVGVVVSGGETVCPLFCRDKNTSTELGDRAYTACCSRIRGADTRSVVRLAGRGPARYRRR